jgi:putative membrane protein
MMLPAMIVFWAAVAWFVVSVVRERSPRPDDTGRAERILAERYARGDIGADEYRGRREDLRE